MTDGVNRMPAPMTLETMMAAPSKGPRRRASVCAGVVVVVVTRRINPRVLVVSRLARLGDALSWLFRQELAIDRKLRPLVPRPRPVLAEHRDPGVDKLAVLEHLQARLL